MHVTDDWLRSLVDSGVLGAIDPRILTAYAAIRRYVWKSKLDYFDRLTLYTERGYVVSRISRPKLCSSLGLSSVRSATRLVSTLSEYGWIRAEGNRVDRVYLLGEWKRSSKFKNSNHGVAVYWMDTALDALILAQLEAAGTDRINKISVEDRSAFARQWLADQS